MTKAAIVLLTFTFALDLRGGEPVEYVKFRDCALTNAECWRKYDVLIKHEFFMQDDDLDEEERLKSFTKTMRFAVDWEKSECFVFSSVNIRQDSNSTSDKIGEGGDNLAPIGKQAETGESQYAQYWMLKEGKAYCRRFPGGNNGIDGHSVGLKKILADSSVPDLRLIGLSNFPSYFKDGDGPFEQMIQARSKPIFRPGATEQVSNLNGTIQVSLFAGQDARVRPSFHYDAKSLMPLESIVRRKIGTQFEIEIDDSYRWTEIDGIFVPVEVLGDTATFPDIAKPSGLHSYQTVRVHWFSLNEQLNSSLFDLSLQQSLGKLMKLVDTEYLGADELK
jgi:hypothetical protein